LRKNLNAWSLSVKREDAGHALSRFLIALDELRTRLAPSKYPNIEISDEGHLWFNIDTQMGTMEVLAIPFGYREIKKPSIIVSLPRKAEDVAPNLPNKMRHIAESIHGARTFAGFSTDEEILSAYRQNRHPPLTFFWDLSDETLQMKGRDVFFSYFGIVFPVADKTVSHVERTVKDIFTGGLKNNNGGIGARVSS